MLWLIITKLEQYDYRGATAIAVVTLSISFLLLLAINGLQRWSKAGGIPARACVGLTKKRYVESPNQIRSRNLRLFGGLAAQGACV
jgi:hypothetical protein